MCANDIRRLENMDLIPEEEGGNFFFTNGSYVRLKDLGSAYVKQQVDEALGRGEKQKEDAPEEKAPEEGSEEESTEETQNRETQRSESTQGKRRNLI